MSRKHKYPGTDKARKEQATWKSRHSVEEEPDFLGLAPNYSKFKDWSAEQVLVYLNID